MAEATEREHIGAATRLLKELTGGEWPLGWYTGRDSPNTRRLVVDHGGFEYDSDYYGDDLPFWTAGDARPTAPLRRTWWCRTRSTPTTCASRSRRASTPATSSSPTCATASTCCTPKATRDAEDDEHRHALPAARPAGPHRRAAALPRPRRGARPGLGRAAASTSRGTGRRRIRSMRRPSSGMSDMALTLDALNAAARGRVRARCSTASTNIRRGSPRRAAASARSRRWRALKRALVEVVRDAARDAQLALIRAHPELAGKAMVGQDADRGVDARAGQGRAHRLHARGVRAHPAAQRRLQRQVRLSVHPRGARPARHGPEQAPRSSPPSRGASPTTPTSSSPRPAQHPPHRRDPT